jgi:hypothetical protein
MSDVGVGDAAVVVTVKHEKQSLEVPLDMGRSASHFMLSIYLLTGVTPMRQKLVGFKGVSGPLLWSADMRAVGAKAGLKLMLIQMPAGYTLSRPS